jgi:hypothetical protein
MKKSDLLLKVLSLIPFDRVITREAWGSQPIKGTPDVHAPARIVVHHTWKPEAGEYLKKATPADRARVVRAIQRYHQYDNGWSDIGYHFLIGPDGTIFLGRDPEHVGAHCGGTPPEGSRHVFGNTGSVGIALIGNHDIEEPTPSALDSLDVLKRAIYTATGKILPVFGHFQAWSPTPPKTCPGKLLIDHLGVVGLSEIWKKLFEKPAKPSVPVQ